MKRVLIIDDALELGRMLRAALESLGADLYVRVLPSAEEALLEVQRAPADLLVVDIRLPGMSGLEFLKKVRERSPKTPVILISGLTEEGILRQAEQSGAQHFLRKPIQVGEFLDIATQLLSIEPAPKQEAVLAPVDSANGEEDLSGLLSRLRRELGAELVLLADERGKVVAQAGEMPGLDFEQHWAPELLPALNTAARAARLVRNSLPQAVLALRGDQLHLVLTPVADYALLLVQKGDGSGLRTALAFEVVLQAQADLLKILNATTTGLFEPSASPLPLVDPTAEVQEVLPASEEPPLADLAAMLEQAPQGFQAENLEDYWESLADAQVVKPENPDVLSYEQARQLGLTPQDEV